MVTVALYKVEAENADYIDTIISWYSGSKYTHVELILSDGYMYSSSYRDNGVRKKLHAKDDNSWDYIEVDADEENIVKFFELTNHADYDLKGIFGFILPIIDRTNKWFCSEWCANALKVSGCQNFWIQSPHKLKPSDFPTILNKR